MIKEIRFALHSSISIPQERASAFFKTGPGDYAEHDQFMGVTVPNLRKISKRFSDLPLACIKDLLSSKINEERFLALLILVDQYQKSTEQGRVDLYQFYINNLHHINNWNLVDTSAHLIVGAHLWDKDRNILLSLSESNNLWERRVSIVSTWAFIKKEDLVWTFQIARLLLNDNHDLIHKAVGWMLREAGKKDEGELVGFLRYHSGVMPRTMLRYAIERLPQDQRKFYLGC
ncbi:MAG: DNA alkylation repair protein [Alphaproteobacteria bacterium]|nr:DNA alkylation repair protein [Alphaproteobacteria bacterium]